MESLFSVRRTNCQYRSSRLCDGYPKHIIRRRLYLIFLIPSQDWFLCLNSDRVSRRWVPIRFKPWGSKNMNLRWRGGIVVNENHGETWQVIQTISQVVVLFRCNGTWFTWLVSVWGQNLALKKPAVTAKPMTCGTRTVHSIDKTGPELSINVPNLTDHWAVVVTQRKDNSRL